MNIGFFSELYHPDINGTVTSIERFMEELELAGHRVTVFAPARTLGGRYGGSQPADAVHRFHSIDYPPYRGFRISFPLYRPVRRKLHTLALDVVHSHTPFSLGIFGQRVARKHDVPHVHSYHTRWPTMARHYLPGPADLNERVVRASLKVFYNAVDRMVVPSAASQEQLEAEGVATPIDVIPTPTEAAAFSAGETGSQTRARYGIPERAPLVLMVARMGQEKSIDYLVRSFAHVERSRPDAWFLLVGDGPARESVEALTRDLGIRHAVFAGELSERKEVLRTYAAADVFVHASLAETQSLTILEASAAGLALVARYDPPLAGSVEHGGNGVFVRGDEAAFAEAIERILANPRLRAAYGTRAKEIAYSNGARKRVEQLECTYRSARNGAG